MQIIKIPGINGLGKTNGCERAGNEILKALDELYTNESGKEIDVRKLNLEEIHLDNSDLVLTNKLIYENSLEAFEEQDKVIFLGGDHSVSFSTTKAFFEHCRKIRKEPCLIVFDAHPDLMPAMKEPTHEEWLRKLIEEGFPVKNILLVGVRNSDPRELEFIQEKKIRVVNMNTLLLDIENACDAIMEFSNGKELYVSVDIDVIDPVFAPATGYKNEIGGLTSRQFLYLIQRINKIKTLRAVDIVEINDKLDKEKFEGMTVKLGAKVLAELL